MRLIASLLIVPLILAGCTSSSPTTGAPDTINVTASFYPLAYVAERIGGTYATVTTVTPPGAEPHDFEPTARDIAELQSADVLIFNGAGLDPWAERVAPKLTEKGVTVIRATDGLTLRKNEEHHDDETSGEMPFEWAGNFTLNAGRYAWSFAKVGGSYADPAMRMVILPTTSGDAAGIEAVEEKAIAHFADDTTTAVSGGDTLTPNETAYTLTFDATKNVTTFVIDIQTAGAYTFFTEHMPTEFEADTHFFKDATGADVEPMATEPAEEEGGHHHHHGAFDPHVWLDPTMLVTMTETIETGFTKADPAHAADYHANAAKLRADLTALDGAFQTNLARCELREIVVSHDAFNYLGSRYGITPLAIAGLSPDVEPSPARLAELATVAKEKGIRHIFFETLVSPRLADTLAREIGAETLVLDPIESLTTDELKAGADYLSVMRENLTHLKTAMRCE